MSSASAGEPSTNGDCGAPPGSEDPVAAPWTRAPSRGDEHGLPAPLASASSLHREDRARQPAPARSASPPGERTQLSHRRRSLLLGASLLALYLPLDLRLPDGWVTASWRLGWILVILTSAWLQRHESPALANWALRIAIVVSGAVAVAVVATAGGTESPRFGFLLAFPLVGLVLFPELPGSVATLGTTCLAGGVGLTLVEGRGPWFVLEWSLASVAMTLLAVTGAVGFRRLWMARLQDQSSRADALERLANNERRWAETDRLAVLGRLAAGVAHDINTPLSYVKSSVQSLRHHMPEEERVEVLADAIHGIDRITQIVAELRGLARGGREPSGPFPAEDAMAEAWRLASVRLEKVRGEWSAESGLPQVMGPQSLLVRALVNLVANAAEAASAEANPGRRWVRARVRQAGGLVLIEVEDGGPGLPPGVLAHLFEPFVSTKGALGTGLGLSLARDHVAKCGGTVEGHNMRDGGARFTVKLPVALPTAARSAPEAHCRPLGEPPRS